MMSRTDIIERVKDAGLPEHAREGLWLDEGVHAVLKKLKEIGKENNTCVFFTTDHPTAGKETCHMGRIPFMVRWPGKIEPGIESDAPLSETDLAATILDIADCDIPADMTQDGKSFKPLLLGQSFRGHRDTVLLEVVNSRAVVSGPWKYIANRLPEYLKATADITKTGWFGSNIYDNERFRESLPYDADKLFPFYFQEDHLYNIAEDPCEQHDLSESPACAEILKDMKKKLQAELAKLPHPFGEFQVV
jgi:arylsulfatase A-like enzyme